MTQVAAIALVVVPFIGLLWVLSQCQRPIAQAAAVGLIVLPVVGLLWVLTQYRRAPVPSRHRAFHGVLSGVGLLGLFVGLMLAIEFGSR